MIGVDTNIIIRFLTHDDKQQYKKAFTIFNSEQIFITDTVILETEWVLRYAYKFSPTEIYNALINLFGLNNVHLTNPAYIAQAMEWYKLELDFTDALHLSQYQNHEKLYTFDKKFSSKATGLSNCSVILPD